MEFVDVIVDRRPVAHAYMRDDRLDGLDPLVRARLPRWKFDEQNIVVARWTREWPKRGRPRQAAPPAETAWPDAA